MNITYAHTNCFYCQGWAGEAETEANRHPNAKAAQVGDYYHWARYYKDTTQALTRRWAPNESETEMTDNHPKTYRKKPVTVQAMRMPDAYPEGEDPSSDNYTRNLQAAAVYAWVESNTAGSFEPLDCIEGRKPWPETGVTIDPRDGRMVIATLEGGHWVEPGDYVIRGVAGEFYPCKPGIFHQTYEQGEA